MAQRNRAYSRGGLQVTHPDAAGVDVGGATHYAAVRADADDEPVRPFNCCTGDLHAMADWFEQCGVRIVAMESTGVYWIPLYEVLERRGFEVLLVNARHVKNVSGRKSDVLDCQWLQQLRTFGLLRGAFRPADHMCALRTFSRQRARLLRDQGRCVQHMQKAMTLMNIQLAHVISDVAGTTGKRIVRAIVAGERDPQTLAACRDVRIHASEAEIAASLLGNWRDEHLFALKQALAAFDFCVAQLVECDGEIERAMTLLHQHAGAPGVAQRRSRAQCAQVRCARAPVQDPRRRSDPHRRHRRDDGDDGDRRDRQLGLCPGTQISGGKVLGAATKRSVNRATQALKLAAAALRSSKSALGAYCSRMCAHMDKGKAVTAAAHKLARLICQMLTKGEEYTDQRQLYYEERYRERVVRNLNKKALELGMQLVPCARPA